MCCSEYTSQDSKSVPVRMYVAVCVVAVCVAVCVVALHFFVYCNEQAVAVCCSVLQCVAVCCSVLQCVAVYGDFCVPACP